MSKSRPRSVVVGLDVRHKMKTFWIAISIYLGGSLALFGLMWLMGFQRRKSFVALFGESIQFDDLDEDQKIRWAEIHDRQFDSGFWRLVALAYMIYHYPGRAFNALRGKSTLQPMSMFIASAAFWIGLLYLIFGLGAGKSEAPANQLNKETNKTSFLTPDPPPVSVAMTATSSTPCSSLAPGQGAGGLDVRHK